MIAGVVAFRLVPWLLLTWFAFGSMMAVAVYRWRGEIAASRVVGFLVWMPLFPPVAIWIAVFAGRWPTRRK